MIKFIKLLTFASFGRFQSRPNVCFSLNPITLSEKVNLATKVPLVLPLKAHFAAGAVIVDVNHTRAEKRLQSM